VTGRRIDLSELGDDGEEGGTERLLGLEAGARTVRRFQLTTVDGPNKGAVWQSGGERATIGSHESNDIQLDEPSVSRFHCELVVDTSGVRIRDLGSKNGTVVDGMQVKEAWLRPGCVIRLGRCTLEFRLATESNRVQLSSATKFGSLVGGSVAMRACFAMLERAAASDVTVLLEGETGTGKEGAADAVHQASARKDAPFLVVDCSAMPAQLLESELFGHERGAFTGAVSTRKGIFEEADSGTVFLDEIGELELALQPKLLRVLERREIRRLGSNTAQKVDVRVVAATNRDLRAEVNAGRFRADLYFRLAVVKIDLPPLRNRPEDIPLLVEALLANARAPRPAGFPSADLLATLQRGAWPGNVRELRNYVERCLVLDEPPPIDEAVAPTHFAFDGGMKYADARENALAAFERAYLADLMARHDHHVATAARAAGLNKVYLYRLLHRHGLMPSGS